MAGKPFQAVNCAAMADTLLESELFGHKRGSFTGADRDRRGLFEEANGGTVFLDEVASMSPSFQGKLLRVLQEKLVRPVGGEQRPARRLRLVAATNRKLEAMVAEGSFREDLYYRLQVVRIPVPPLRERPADVLALADWFLERVSAECLGPGATVPELSPEATSALEAHPWPATCVSWRTPFSAPWSCVVESGSFPSISALATSGARRWTAGWRPRWAAWAQGLRVWIRSRPTTLPPSKLRWRTFQREFVQGALERSGGNVSQAASACGMTRAALQKILRQLGIDRASFEEGV